MLILSLSYKRETHSKDLKKSSEIEYSVAKVWLQSLLKLVLNSYFKAKIRIYSCHRADG